MSRPYQILLHTDSPATGQLWRRCLPEPMFAVLDQPRELPPGVPLDVLLASQLAPEERQRLLDERILRPETRIAIVGPGGGAHLRLPANCSPGELRRACRLLGQLARRQRTILRQRCALRRLARQARTDPLTGL
ncbi:MAG: hypothetical protein J5I93_19570, partial [Pirellulaceae bacterium]|nr:hypothetical protein [Pirellulaceae bacterium]